MPDALPVGPMLPDPACAMVEQAIAAAQHGGQLQPGVRLLDGGMEDAIAPYLVLATADDAWLLLLERRNDDGEWDALVYPPPPALRGQPYTPALAQQAMAGYGEFAQELGYGELAEYGLAVDEAAGEALGDWLRETLFGFRALVSPHALD